MKLLLGLLMLLSGIVATTGCDRSEATPGKRAALDGADLLPQLQCGNPIDILTELPPNYREIAGELGLPEANLMRRTIHSNADAPGSMNGFTKFGLIVRTNGEFSLRVSRASEGKALLQWGDADTVGPVPALSVMDCSSSCNASQPACKGTKEGDWLVFPGGVWTSESQCLEIVISTRDGEHVAKLPIGIAC
jgi:hypothetical protein